MSDLPAPPAPTRPDQSHPAPLGRIPVTEVFPVVEDGLWPAKATQGEAFPVRATVFREGHDAFAATAVLLDPQGNVHSTAPMVEIAPGLDRYEAWLMPDAPGQWSFRVEGWSDPYATWSHDATVKINAGSDVELMLTEGALLLERAAARSLPAEAQRVLTTAAAHLRDGARPPQARLSAGLSPQVRRVLAAHPLRDMVSPSRTYPLAVHRPLALASAWYEIFPRSIGAYQHADGSWQSGTLATAAADLPRIAGMGFDVVYLTPIHPIGTTNRKGRNNTLRAEPGDPGSPYGIGSAAGGHEAIHPDLGTEEDFAAFVARARQLGLEVALDIALQCSPDHPWVTEHPDWFTIRADGSIAYAENPPKKYQDIYPLNFDKDPEGIYVAIRDMLLGWIDLGVTLFRVDNPHTKPVSFWQRLLAEINAQHPEVIFLSEAFTRPAMMRTLGAVGFHQSYTYFTWRTGAGELGQYLVELAEQTAHLLRPNFWPTTHDILTPQMWDGGAPIFAARAVLAATASPSWGIYNGYELLEDVPRPGAQEQIDNEKYEYKPRDYSRADGLGIAPLLARLNAIRADHPALRQLHRVTIHPTSNEALFCFSKHVPAHLSPTGRADTVLVVVNLDPHHQQSGILYLNVAALGVGGADGSAGLRVRDELDGAEYTWNATPYVELSPFGHLPIGKMAHVLEVSAQ
ncbi:maltotransferase domain-containing protein [Buchananella hordeovulneris]|uniref:maltotransferase domain-containing protein n=1 Tax=Buchananella hordeovulneris TaxID=52770 RepID=UPI003F65E75B